MGDETRKEEAAGWRGELSLGFVREGGRTVLKQRRFFGPLRVQRPFYPEPEVCHVYLLHPPGGVAGGDRNAIAVTAAPGARALLTTPGATRFYRSAGPRASWRQSLVAAAGSSLEWFPQENLLFNGAMADLETRVELGAGASYIGWEILCLGRPARGERYRQGRCAFSYEVWREGQPLLVERLAFGGGDPVLQAPWGLRGLPVWAALVATAPGGDCLARLREALEGEAGELGGLWGVTLVDGLLVCRCLGDSVEQIKRRFTALWGIWRQQAAGRASCPPRIWQT